MSLISELDALTEKLQARVDAAVAEAWQGLQGMASEVEAEWNGMRREWCPSPVVETSPPTAEAPSHPETSPDGAEHHPAA